MLNSGVRKFGTVAAVVLSATGLGMSGASGAVAGPLPIAPHQVFLGQVNGSSSGAVIRVACGGPMAAGTGHPVSGQTVAVVPELAVPVGARPGYTGESADHILVYYGNSTAAEPYITLDSYYETAEIPTDVFMPCTGTGRIVFNPWPTSSTSGSGFITVTYESVAD